MQTYVSSYTDQSHEFSAVCYCFGFACFLFLWEELELIHKEGSTWCKITPENVYFWSLAVWNYIKPCPIIYEERAVRIKMAKN